MRGILISSFIFILLSGCEEIPAPVNTSTILVKPLAEMIETTLNLDNTAQEAEVPENDTMIDEEVETVAPPEGLYEPVLSMPGGNEASKQAIVIKKIREITLKKRTKTLNLFEYSASQGQFSFLRLHVKCQQVSFLPHLQRLQWQLRCRLLAP